MRSALKTYILKPNFINRLFSRYSAAAACKFFFFFYKLTDCMLVWQAVGGILRQWSFPLFKSFLFPKDPGGSFKLRLTSSLMSGYRHLIFKQGNKQC